MSHNGSYEVKGFDSVHPVVLGEGIKVGCQLLALHGIEVSNHILDWNGRKVTEFEGQKIICALDVQGKASSRKFAGLGLAVDKNGKLAIIGDFYYQEQKNRRKELQAMLEKVLGGACYFAARALIASAKGQKTEVKINTETCQLQLVVQM
jgi:hypothetical protein